MPQQGPQVVPRADLTATVLTITSQIAEEPASRSS